MTAPPVDMPQLAECVFAGIPDAFERKLLDLGSAARAAASGVFVSGFSLDDAIRFNARPATGDGEPISFSLDAANGLVHASTADGARRSARDCGDQGAVLLPVGAHKVMFEPRMITSSLGPAEATAWPMGDAGTGLDIPRAKRALDTAFSDERAMTSAVIIVHRGQIIGERYSKGVTRQTQLQSWSMGKSLVALLIGRMAAMGWLDLDATGVLEEWGAPSDPRREISVRHLLQMSSGLDFTALWKDDFSPGRGYPDHAYMYAGAIDVERLALTRPLAGRPGTVGAYQNCDTLALLAILKRLCRKRGLDPLQAPQTLLLDPIGVRRLVLETDVYGNPVATGLNYGTARDWARLGLLWLNDGVWNGDRLLPEGFVAFCRTPAQAWRGRYWLQQAQAGFSDSIYGGHVWLNRFAPDDRWPLPEDAFQMLGVAGQHTFIVPSLDLVVVRLGHFRGMEAGLGRQPLAAALAALSEAL